MNRFHFILLAYGYILICNFCNIPRLSFIIPTMQGYVEITFTIWQLICFAKYIFFGNFEIMTLFPDFLASQHKSSITYCTEQETVKLRLTLNWSHLKSFENGHVWQKKGSVRLFLTKNPARAFSCPSCKVRSVSFERFPRPWQMGYMTPRLYKKKQCFARYLIIKHVFFLRRQWNFIVQNV